MPYHGNVSQTKEMKEKHVSDHAESWGDAGDTKKILNLPNAETLKCMVVPVTEESGFQGLDKIRAMGSTSCASSNMISNPASNYTHENSQIKLNCVGPHYTGWMPQKRLELTGTEALKDMILSVSSAHSKEYSGNRNMVHTSNNLSMNTSNSNALRNSLELLLGNQLLQSNSSINDIRIGDFNEHAFKSSLGYDSSANVGEEVLMYQMLSSFNQGPIARTEMAHNASENFKEVKKRENNRKNAARSRIRSKEFVNRLKITVQKLTGQTMVLQNENDALRLKVSLLEKELHDRDAVKDNVQAEYGSEAHSESKNLNVESTLKAHNIRPGGGSEIHSTSEIFNEKNTEKTDKTTKRSIGKETICDTAFDAEFSVKSPPMQGSQVTALSEASKMYGNETRIPPGSGIFDINTRLFNVSDNGKNVSHSVDKETVSKNTYLVNGESYVKKPSQKHKNNETINSRNEVLVSEKAHVRINNATPLLPIKNSVVSSYLRKRNLEQEAPNAKKHSVSTEEEHERSTSASLDTLKLNNPGQFCNNNMLASTFNHILGFPTVDQTAMFHQVIQLSNQIPSGENLKGFSSNTGAGLISPFEGNSTSSQSLLSKEIDLYKESLTRQVLQYSNPLGHLMSSNTSMNSVHPNVMVSPPNSFQATSNVPLLDSSFIRQDLTHLQNGNIFHLQPFASQNQRCHPKH